MGVGIWLAAHERASNLTFVFDSRSFGSRPATRSLTYPGHRKVTRLTSGVPLLSFGLSNGIANLTNATVTMTSNGVPVSVAIQPIRIVTARTRWSGCRWALMQRPRNIISFNGTDTVYDVTIAILSLTVHPTVFL